MIAENDALATAADQEPAGAPRADAAEDAVTGQLLSLPEVMLGGGLVAAVAGGTFGAAAYTAGAAGAVLGIAIGEAFYGSGSSGHSTNIAPGT
jgi:hypothetical protein